MGPCRAATCGASRYSEFLLAASDAKLAASDAKFHRSDAKFHRSDAKLYRSDAKLDMRRGARVRFAPFDTAPSPFALLAPDADANSRTAHRCSRRIMLGDPRTPNPARPT
jgi:hypothetical protein